MPFIEYLIPVLLVGYFVIEVSYIVIVERREMDNVNHYLDNSGLTGKHYEEESVRLTKQVIDRGISKVLDVLIRIIKAIVGIVIIGFLVYYFGIR